MFLVHGCGVSLICEKGEVMMSWIQYILARGGAPSIQPINQEELRPA